MLFSIVRNIISVSKVASLLDSSLRLFSKCLGLFLVPGSYLLVPCGYLLVPCISKGVFVFVIVIGFLLAWPCLLIILMKCFKGHKSLELLLVVLCPPRGQGYSLKCPGATSGGTENKEKQTFQIFLIHHPCPPWYVEQQVGV